MKRSARTVIILGDRLPQEPRPSDVRSGDFRALPANRTQTDAHIDVTRPLSIVINALKPEDHAVRSLALVSFAALLIATFATAGEQQASPPVPAETPSSNDKAARPDRPIAERYRIRGYPTVFVVDAKGVIRIRAISSVGLDAAVDKLLAEMKQPASG
jgi:hypothetical protein